MVDMEEVRDIWEGLEGEKGGEHYVIVFYFFILKDFFKTVQGKQIPTCRRMEIECL